MTNQEFYNLLDQAGHRLGNLAKNSPGYAFELRKLIEIVEGEYKQDAMRYQKIKELNFDIGYYHPDNCCEDTTGWFEYYETFDIDNLINSGNHNAN